MELSEIVTLARVETESGSSIGASVTTDPDPEHGLWILQIRGHHRVYARGSFSACVVGPEAEVWERLPRLLEALVADPALREPALRQARTMLDWLVRRVLNPGQPATTIDAILGDDHPPF